MKPPRAYARGILHFFGAIRRSTLLRSPSFGRSPLRIHPWTHVHGLLRRRIKRSPKASNKRITDGHLAGDLHFDDENCQLLASNRIDITVLPLPYLEFLLEKASDSLSDSDPQRDSYKTNLNLFDNAFTRCYRKIPWSRLDLDVVAWSDGGPREGMFFSRLSHKSTRIPLGRKRKSPRNSLRRAQPAISAREGR